MRIRLLRAASVLTAIFTIGHSMGVFSAPDAAMAPAAKVMKSVHFSLFGADRTYWQMFKGYGVLIIFVAAYMALLYWLLPPKKVLCLTAGLQIAVAIVSFLHFFWLPGVLNAVSAALVLFASMRE